MYIEKKVLKDNKRGLIICFIGQDGAGKSTVSNDILTWLRWKIEAKKFYLGSGDHYHSWKKNVIKKLSEGSKNPLKKALTGILSVWDSVSLAHHVYKTILFANKYANNGGIAIFDRYPQIQYNGINDGPKIRCNVLPRIPGFLAKSIVKLFAQREEKYLLKASSYSPDIVFKLSLSVEESMRRKPEEVIENVQKKHDIIKSLEFNTSTVYEINAEQDYQQELLSIKNIIWKHLQNNTELD